MEHAEKRIQCAAYVIKNTSIEELWAKARAHIAQINGSGEQKSIWKQR